MIYIHIPFCKQRCIYCAFYSVASKSGIQEYVDALCKELVMRKSYLKTEKIETIYFGGGTPSVLSIAQLCQVYNVFKQNYDLSDLCEVTMEANPEQLTIDYLEDLKRLEFINRISIGVQTFDDYGLKILNRCHTGKMAIDAVNNAYKIGFDNITVDLIYGISGSDATQWQNNLNILETLNVKHLSCYALTVEPGTMLYTLIQKGKIANVDENEIIRQYDILIDWVKRNDFVQYEISNFAKPGYEAKHNSRYWNATAYMGVGAAAHSFNGSSRQWNIDNVVQYISAIDKGEIPCTIETLSEKDMYNEYVMTALRTTKGLESCMLNKYLHFWNDAEKYIDTYMRNGMMIKTETGYKLSEKGLLFADAIASDLFRL